MVKIARSFGPGRFAKGFSSDGPTGLGLGYAPRGGIRGAPNRGSTNGKLENGKGKGELGKKPAIRKREEARQGTRPARKNPGRHRKTTLSSVMRSGGSFKGRGRVGRTKKERVGCEKMSRGKGGKTAVQGIPGETSSGEKQTNLLCLRPGGRLNQL